MIMKKSFFKYAVLFLSLAAIQACNENTVDNDILDPDVPLNAETYTTPEGESNPAETDAQLESAASAQQVEQMA